MIKSIAEIARVAVFQSFNWDATVRDKDNRPVYFKAVNVLYGRNYSGKTTLSRIIRALETGQLSDKYASPAFKVQLADSTVVTHVLPLAHSQTIRVFNEDFVRLNFRFFTDEADGITPLAVLGSDNTELSEQIKSKRESLGSEEDPGSLRGKLRAQLDDLTAARTAHNSAAEAVEEKLRLKANDPKTGIKHNKTYGDANYNITKIKADIAAVSLPGYQRLTDNEATTLSALLKEVAKSEVVESPALALEYASLHTTAKELLARSVSASAPLQELLDDPILQEWVRHGRQLHENKRTICGFCGNALPQTLWNKLDQHFSTASETLRGEISTLLAQVSAERQRVEALLQIDCDLFYADYASPLKDLIARAKKAKRSYVSNFDALADALDARLKDIFAAKPFAAGKDVSTELEAIRDQYESLRVRFNVDAASLNRRQGEARQQLRLHAVATFVTDIGYADLVAKVERLKVQWDTRREDYAAASEAVQAAEAEISRLQAQTKDETNGAKKVNEFLSHHFGHPSLSLRAVANGDGSATQYRFEVFRNNERAHHLSEGEKGLLAFCYFMARLQDVNTLGRKPIIWIDDPVSSLDDSHMFFVHSLINSGIIEGGDFTQLFISTHSLSFLKYLKRLRTPKNLERGYFLVHRDGDCSEMRLMPRHLKEYATEFHYLFHQIHRCANADENDVDVFYNFGNTLRKFLEMFLYFKYPDAREDDGTKLRRFFGKDRLAASVVERVDNEYSHLSGLFERGVLPVDVPAMKKVAAYVLATIDAADHDQYASLLESIGVQATLAPVPAPSGGSSSA